MSSTERVINLCASPPEQRKENDIEFVAKWVGANSSYFRNIRKDAICEVVRDCRLQLFTRNKLIIRQGEKGDSFYVVIVGRVSVYVNSELEQLDEDGNEVPADEARAKDVAAASREEDAQSEGDAEEETGAEAEEFMVDQEQKEDGEELRSRLLGTKVLQMGEGYAFGEIALTSVNSIRKASVICDEDASVLVIHQASYARSLRTYQDQEYQLIDSFIDSCPLFASFHPKQLRSLRNSLRREQFEFGEPIVRQGQQSGGLFFIVRGSVKLLTDPSKWPALNKPSEPPQAAATADASAAAASAAAAVLNRRRQGYEAAEQRQRRKQLEIVLLGEGEILGQVELLAGLSKSLTSSIAIEATSGYWLNRANCRRLIGRHRATVAQLRQSVLLRLQSRARRAPLMESLSRDPRIVGRQAAAAAAAIASVMPDPVAAELALQTRKQPPSDDLLWQHMLAMYIEGRTQLGPVPSDPSLYYRHLCRVNAKRRHQLRERAKPPKLEERETEASSPQLQRVPKSLKLLRRELEAGIRHDLRQSVETDANKLAFRPAAVGKSGVDPHGEAAASDPAASGRQRIVSGKSSGAPALRVLTNFEVSKTHLRLLERRIEAFCGGWEGASEAVGGSWRNRRPHVEPLLRLPDADAQRGRLRGSRVLVKTKACTANKGGTAVLGHSHVTNHLVQSLPDWDLVLRTRRERLRHLEQMALNQSSA